MIHNGSFSARIQKWEKTDTFVTIGDMYDTIYVRGGVGGGGVSKTDIYNCMCFYSPVDSICVFSEFV